MELMLGIGTLILVYVLAMWGRPSAGSGGRQPAADERPGRRRWHISVDSIPEEDEGCQSDPAECIDTSDEEEDDALLHGPPEAALCARRAVLAGRAQ
ncbi:hypothetical protein FJT64_017180 [Amphibalanus amphitrite]|uniref:Uncharacterized protein n=1 Tax=Amphibalanus amphitrite TaxID=1232801 RepID=A0A6A4WY85_AMPAM|nr:hypothetical protein FJT64_017180 [Amphibalanus amphitrite]